MEDRALLQKGYPKKNLHIIAVAGNYDEALLLACDIVKETYENTGKTDVKSYLKRIFLKSLEWRRIII